MREIMVWDADQTVLFGEKEVSLQISKRLSPEVPADVVKSQLGVGVDTRSCSYTTLFGMSGKVILPRFDGSSATSVLQSSGDQDALA